LDRRRASYTCGSILSNPSGSQTAADARRPELSVELISRPAKCGDAEWTARRKWKSLHGSLEQSLADVMRRKQTLQSEPEPWVEVWHTVPC
jgi:hypothetical protein